MLRTQRDDEKVRITDPIRCTAEYAVNNVIAGVAGGDIMRTYEEKMCTALK